MNNHIQNKLSGFEAPPPAGVWDNIAEALDTENYFAQRLYDYQQQPKENIWNKIEANVEKSLGVKVVPFFTRYRKPIRYMAAASIIAVILVSATLLMKRTETGSVATVNEKIRPGNEATIQQPATPTINANNQTETKASTLSNNQNAVYKTGAAKKRILSFIKPQNILKAVVFVGGFVPQEPGKKEMFKSSSLNDFMIYSDEDGNAMKLPKKLFSLVNCPNGDDSCKERILNMQQKLSSASIASGFTGILEMLRQLQ